ncbi:hypothetical protein [Paraglaciecola sp. 20A4]|uniref:hypothetical protein n=1 Tax=Paraglaciecola sp. 20A4 TaxID=2687288 RepID=UPI0014074033|nr:hypothetical protein [Paraglaciecola sp. 20A4]
MYKYPLVALTFCLIASGCAYLPGGGAAFIPTTTITKSGIDKIAEKYQNAVCTKQDTSKGCSAEGAIRDKSWLANINTCQDPARVPATCKILRNNIINELLLISDHYYHIYEGGMLAGNAKNNFYTGALRTSLETAGALITVADTTKILSGLAALTGTLQDSASQEFYFDNTIDALITQMRADRTKAVIPLLSKQKADYDDYSIETAISDINTYYRAGTLASAIISISKSASAAQEKNETDLNTALN